MGRLHDLGRNTPTTVTRFLDSRVRERILVRNNDNKKLRVFLEFDAGGVVQALDRFANVFFQFQDDGVSDDSATMAGVHGLERITEILHLGTIGRIPFAGEETNSPRIKRFLVGLIEFLAPQIPAAVGAWVVTLVATKLDLRVWK